MTHPVVEEAKSRWSEADRRLQLARHSYQEKATEETEEKLRAAVRLEAVALDLWQRAVEDFGDATDRLAFATATHFTMKAGP